MFTQRKTDIIKKPLTAKCANIKLNKYFLFPQ